MNETRLRFYLDDVQVYSHYFGEFDLETKYQSPFPHRNDPNPSFMFKNIGTFSNPKIIWNDFGLNDVKYKDAVGFVCEFFDLERKEAVKKIWVDLVVNKDIVLKKTKIEQPIKLLYEYTVGDVDTNYWDRFGFTEDFLKFFKIYSLVSLRRMGKKIWGTTEINPTFIYLFSKPKSFKTYRPLDPMKDKFRGQNNGDILEGYDQLPRNGDHLFVMASLKETSVARFIGYLGLNPTSENSRKTLLSKVRELNGRFKKIRILFDNDTPGIVAARSLSRDTGWEVVMLPYRVKDHSDLVMNSKGSYLELSMFFSKFKINKYHTNELDNFYNSNNTDDTV